MEQICKNCKFFKPDTTLVERTDGTQYEENEDYGQCEHNKFISGQINDKPVRHGVLYGSYTTEDPVDNFIEFNENFGCKHFAAKEGAKG